MFSVYGCRDGGLWDRVFPIQRSLCGSSSNIKPHQVRMSFETGSCFWQTFGPVEQSQESDWLRRSLGVTAELSGSDCDSDASSAVQSDFGDISLLNGLLKYIMHLLHLWDSRQDIYHTGSQRKDEVCSISLFPAECRVKPIFEVQIVSMSSRAKI